MIGKRRFTVVMTALCIAAVLEIFGQIMKVGGISTNGQIALATLVGLYMGSKFAEKPELGGK